MGGLGLGLGLGLEMGLGLGLGLGLVLGFGLDLGLRARVGTPWARVGLLGLGLELESGWRTARRPGARTPLRRRGWSRAVWWPPGQG